MKAGSVQRTGWTRIFPPLTWLAEYKPSWLRQVAIAGVTLAAYAIPVSLAYAALAGLPPQVGIYGYMPSGIGYALLGSLSATLDLDQRSERAGRQNRQHQVTHQNLLGDFLRYMVGGVRIEICRSVEYFATLLAQ
jgi:hypothetical protein